MARGSKEGIRLAQARRWPHWRERFAARVDRTPGHGPWGDCHLWTGACTGAAGNRYGTIGIDGRPRRAHHVAFFIAHGRWPTPLALHRCDVSTCVNPTHIVEGTQSQNMLEARRRGRVTTNLTNRPRARGESHPKAAFTEQDIRWIRNVHAQDMMSVADLAREFCVGWSTIDCIVKRKTWRHVT